MDSFSYFVLFVVAIPIWDIPGKLARSFLLAEAVNR